MQPAFKGFDLQIQADGLTDQGLRNRAPIFFIHQNFIPCRPGGLGQAAPQIDFKQRQKSHLVGGNRLPASDIDTAEATFIPVIIKIYLGPTVGTGLNIFGPGLQNPGRSLFQIPVIPQYILNEPVDLGIIEIIPPAIGNHSIGAGLDRVALIKFRDFDIYIRALILGAQIDTSDQCAQHDNDRTDQKKATHHGFVSFVLIPIH